MSLENRPHSFFSLYQIIRRPMTRPLITLIALAATLDPLSGAMARRRSVAMPPFPPCSMVTGTPAVTFTRDDGRTLAPRAEALSGIGYTYGLAALDTPNTLLAWHKNDLILSSDAGCSWRVVATFTDRPTPPSIEPAQGGRAYAWSHNGQFMVRYDARGAAKLKPPMAFLGVETDPDNGEFLRAGDVVGTIWESRDGGDSWSVLGTLPWEDPGRNPILYRFAFNPTDFDHIVVGTAVTGAFVTRDAGRHWTRAAGFGEGGANVTNVVFSPSDPNVVWAMAITLTDLRKQIYRSTDGGTSFSPVISHGPGVILVSGLVMAAHPTDPQRLYFVFGAPGYGTDFFRYDDASNTLSVAHNNVDDIDAIAFSPADPRVIYLGLTTEIRVVP